MIRLKNIGYVHLTLGDKSSCGFSFKTYGAVRNILLCLRSRVRDRLTLGRFSEDIFQVNLLLTENGFADIIGQIYEMGQRFFI